MTLNVVVKSDWARILVLVACIPTKINCSELDDLKRRISAPRPRGTEQDEQPLLMVLIAVS